MRMRFLSPLLLISLAAPAVAQQYMPREVLAADFQRQKGILMQYVDAMPDAGMSFMPTQGVRTYAQQLEHIAQATAGIGGQAAKASSPAPKGDPAVYLKDKAALKAFIAASFDHAIAALNAMTPADMTEEINIFNLGNRPRWKWILGVQEHTAWTLGQTVPYLRLNGVTPPSYLPF